MKLPDRYCERLAQLENLKLGWFGESYPSSEPPSPQSIKMAEYFLLVILQQEGANPHVYPLLMGGIQIEWKTISGEVTTNCEVEIFNSGTLNVDSYIAD